MEESRYLEFKEKITNTFLKTVSAFANFGTGEIRFGVNDSGESIGLDQIAEARLDIENKINDSIHPKPDYYFTVNKKRKILSLFVLEGPDKPYLYKGKAYQRNDTATVEVDALELRRLTLAGMNLTFEQLRSSDQDLSFEILQRKMKEVLGIHEISRDILKTLNLYDDKKGYNNAAALLADRNNFPGIDIVRFGKNIDIIKNRKKLKGISILEQYQQSIDFYIQYYQEEVIEGSVRNKRELVPEKAYREAVANALVHRTWDVGADIHISMFDDRIEIASIGSLPFGMSREEYLRGGVSILRNPIIANVFYRLHYIEAFGTGVIRMRNAYRGFHTEPGFEFYDNSIRIILPLLNRRPEMTVDERRVYDSFNGHRIFSSSELVQETGMNKSKVLRILHSLQEKNLIVTTGRGRGTRYSR